MIQINENEITKIIILTCLRFGVDHIYYFNTFYDTDKIGVLIYISKKLNNYGMNE